jgi:predicted lipoprotein with Yx(FWY)xxD motif
MGNREIHGYGGEKKMKRAQYLFLAASGAAAAIALAACGSSGSGNGYGTGSGGGAAPAATTAQGGGSATTAALSTTSSGSLGTIVTDSKNRTVYLYTKDTPNSGTSTCTATCATNWPPVAAGSGTPTVNGINQSLVGSITRPDGTKQLTLAGWPLYEFAADTAPGDATGQGKGGIWFAVTPTGAKAGAAPAATTAAGGGVGGGY